MLPIARSFDVPAISNPVGATFGDELTLLGYDLNEADGEILVTVYWQAQRRMAHSYKIFAHLLDANGQRAAQHDAVPRQWAYPTTQWDAGEVVADGITLSWRTPTRRGPIKSCWASMMSSRASAWRRWMPMVCGRRRMRCCWRRCGNNLLNLRNLLILSMKSFWQWFLFPYWPSRSWR
ncbi:MAG: hypothetical protein R2911_27780 [Caldilineaceae bacterium]